MRRCLPCGMYVFATVLILRARTHVQVLPIWEGTTNVLALDVMRVVSHDPTSLHDFLVDCERRAGARGQVRVCVCVCVCVFACDVTRVCRHRWLLVVLRSSPQCTLHCSSTQLYR
jgi:hypothetical protein